MTSVRAVRGKPSVPKRTHTTRDREEWWLAGGEGLAVRFMGHGASDSSSFRYSPLCATPAMVREHDRALETGLFHLGRCTAIGRDAAGVGYGLDLLGWWGFRFGGV